VASNRVKELERRLGVRLFNRTTRSLTPTEVGKVFYEHAREVVDSLEDAEAVGAGCSNSPRGSIQVSAPLGVGRRLIAPLIPKFAENYPNIEIRLRLSDRIVDILQDRIDVAFFLGEAKDSNLKLRKIMDCDRVLCATPEYLAQHGTPTTPDDLINQNHNCLLLRYPRSPEYYWTLNTANGPKKFDVSGKYDADDGDVLTKWAIAGHGIINKPRFDISKFLDDGSLVEVLQETPPISSSFGCLYPHRKLQDPKIRLLIDFMVQEIRKAF
jgi:DNA-binding transcriptional LysR family regulator